MNTDKIFGYPPRCLERVRVKGDLKKVSDHSFSGFASSFACTLAHSRDGAIASKALKKNQIGSVQCWTRTSDVLHRKQSHHVMIFSEIKVK